MVKFMNATRMKVATVDFSPILAITERGFEHRTYRIRNVSAGQLISTCDGRPVLGFDC
jgi:hypothetical protein